MLSFSGNLRIDIFSINADNNLGSCTNSEFSNFNHIILTIFKVFSAEFML